MARDDASRAIGKIVSVSADRLVVELHRGSDNFTVIGFDDEEDAIHIANDVIYGLAAGVWTQNIGRAVRMSDALKVGTVWVNTYRAVSYMMPFGGTKMSGIGRENGIEAISEFLETKAVWVNTSDEFPANPFVMR